MPFFRWHLSSTLRVLRRQWPYVLINVTGLALGLAATVLILLYVHDEFSYDTHHPGAEHTYRVTYERSGSQTGTTRFASAPPAVGPTLTSHIPEVETAARLSPTDLTLTIPGRRSVEEEVVFADPTAFDLFAFTPVRGEPSTAFTRPGALVLTVDAAERLFGSVDVLGRTVTVERRGQQVESEVRAVVEGLPSNSHIRPQVLASFQTLTEMVPWYTEENWIFRGSYTYVRLDPSASPADVASRLPALVDRETKAEQERYGMEAALHLQPLTDIHLYSQLPDEVNPGGAPGQLYILLSIAGLILLLSSVNYVNLASAQAVERAADVSVRKVFGADRGPLVQQYLSEAVLLAFGAMILAVELVVLVLPGFNHVAAKSFAVGDVLTMPLFWIGLGGLTLLIGLASGTYPALTIAKTSPMTILRGRRTSDPSGTMLRRVLIGGQFAVAMLLLTATFVTSDQLRYMQTADLGFDENRVLILDQPDRMQEARSETVASEIQSHPDVQSVSFSSHVPTQGDRFNTQMRPARAETDTEITGYRVSPEYISTLGHRIVDGRDFVRGRASDSTGVLINEAAARAFGWAEPVGQTLVQDQGDGETLQFRVLGVVEDFHARSLRHEVAPIVIQMDDHRRDFVAVRIGSSDPSAILTHLRSVWEDLAPGAVFEYSFLDASVEAQYRAEERLAWLIRAFSGLAIFIACIGLGGLSAYLANRRTREIGVRKSIGATTWDVIRLLTKDFALLVVGAIGVTTPLAVILMQTWLEQFAYRTPLKPLGFVGAAVIVLALAVVTVAAQAYRAAQTDPVTAIRD